MTLLKKLRALSRLSVATAAVILLASLYWGVVASDRFVSEAVIVVDRTDLAGDKGGADVVSMITGGGGGGSHFRDHALLRNYLISTDMLEKLDAKLDLRGHYSDKSRDLLSRMWKKDISREYFHDHFLSRANAEADVVEGVLRLRVQAYTPEMARAITLAIVEYGEAFLNEMVHRLASEQVSFLEDQVAKLGERVRNTRNALVDYQNSKGLISPQGAAESLSSIAARLESQISELKARREALLGYLSPGAPDVAQLNLQIAAQEKQLRTEMNKMAAPQGKTLNRFVEEYQRLQMEADFAKDLYRSALVALERGRVESVRTLKKLTVLQSPTSPQYPLEPRRTYNTIVWIIAALVVSGIVQMLAAIIRDHKD